MTQDTYASAFQSTLYVPYGAIKRLSDFEGKVAKRLARMGDIPVLSGRFNANMFGPVEGRPQHVGWGSLGAAHAILTVRMQVGPDMLYWMANAADPEIWAMLDAWHKHRTMVVAAEFDNASAVVATRDFELSPSLRSLRPKGDVRDWSENAERFLREAGSLLFTGKLGMGATTDIPSVPSLRCVQGCTIATERTGRVVVPAEISKSAMCNLVSAAGLVEFAPMHDVHH